MFKDLASTSKLWHWSVIITTITEQMRKANGFRTKVSFYSRYIFSWETEWGVMRIESSIVHTWWHGIKVPLRNESHGKVWNKMVLAHTAQKPNLGHSFKKLENSVFETVWKNAGTNNNNNKKTLLVEEMLPAAKKHFHCRVLTSTAK